MSTATPSTPSVSSVTEQLASTTVSDDKTEKNNNNSGDKEDTEEEEVAPVSFVTGLHPEDNEAKVTVNNSDIYNAAKSFDELGLRKEILTAIYEMKFNNPSKIQAAALPIVLSKDHPNLIGQAHHGSGKTAAFSLCVLSQIDETKLYPQAVIVAPVRELAIQISSVINSLAKYTQIKVATLIKNADTSGKITQQVIVGTPGSILGAMQYKRLDSRSIKVFVADEADHMVDKGEGMGEQTLRIKQMLPPRMQILLFSATFSDRVKKFAERIAPKAVEIFVKREDLSLDKIAQYYIECKDEGDKFTQLAGILSASVSGQCIIFVRTVATAKLLTNRMREEGFAVSLLHGQDMDVKERDKVMADFRENRTTILITTNVLSRGIDVLTVTLVINFDIPTKKDGKADFETYVHRIGRSGRFGRKGVAINFIINGGKCKENLGRIAAYFAKNIIQLPNDPDVIAEEIKKSLK